MVSILTFGCSDFSVNCANPLVLVGATRTAPILRINPLEVVDILVALDQYHISIYAKDYVLQL